MWKVTCDTAVKVEKDSNFVTNTILYENNKKVIYIENQADIGYYMELLRKE